MGAKHRRRSFPKRVLRRFLVAVDSEGVALFQWTFYLILALDGAQNFFVAHAAPFTLQGSMSPTSFLWWCLLEMIGPLCCLLGRVVHPTSFWKAGNTLQLLGDLTLGGAELSYVTATFHVEPIGHGGHGGYLGLAVVISTVFLGLRDYRRGRSEKLNR